MNQRRLLIAGVTLLLNFLACNVPSAAQPTISPAPPRVATDTETATAESATASEAPSDVAPFVQRLKDALVAEDYAALEGMMGAAFYVQYYGAEGAYIAISDAVTLIEEELRGAEPVRFDEAADPATLTSADFAPPDLQVADALFSTGWGRTSADHAIILVSTAPDGSHYFSGLLLARGGYPNALTPTVTDTSSPTPTEAIQALPTANPAPRGPVIYQTDFPSGSWFTFDETDGRGQHVEEGYELQVFRWAKWLYSTRVQESEFYAELIAEPQSCPVGQGGYGILFQRQSNSTFRWFIVWCSGLFSLHEGTGTTTGTTLHEGRLPSGIDPASGIHRLGVLADSNSLALYFDDVRLTAVGIATMPSGDVGIYGETTGSQTLHVVFSSLTVYEAE